MPALHLAMALRDSLIGSGLSLAVADHIAYASEADKVKLGGP